MDTDVEWEEWGRTDPYYGVVTYERYRRRNLTPGALVEFFSSGKDHVEHVLEVCRRRLDPAFSPKRILDFGCGVGRTVIPFAEVADSVVGLDVSPSMLDEARRNCSEHGLTNVTLLRSDDELTSLTGQFDLIHSFIVFQHIPIERGRQIFTGLLPHLDEGGIGAIHLTYSKLRFSDNHGLPPAEKPPSRRGLLRQRLVRAKRIVRTLIKGPTSHEPRKRDPVIQMNPYNLNELFFQLQSAGIDDVHVEFTDHEGELGVFLYFRRPVPA